MEKELGIIKGGRGIHSIIRFNDGVYEIHYYTRQGNLAVIEGNEAKVAGILEYNASLPSFKQKRIQDR
jgi:hypothetical protein